MQVYFTDVVLSNCRLCQVVTTTFIGQEPADYLQPSRRLSHADFPPHLTAHLNTLGWNSIQWPQIVGTQYQNVMTD